MAALSADAKGRKKFNTMDGSRRTRARRKLLIYKSFRYYQNQEKRKKTATKIDPNNQFVVTIYYIKVIVSKNIYGVLLGLFHTSISIRQITTIYERSYESYLHTTHTETHARWLQFIVDIHYMLVSSVISTVDARLRQFRSLSSGE